MRDQAAADDDDQRRAPARERRGGTKVAWSWRSTSCIPQDLVRGCETGRIGYGGVNALAWKSQPRAAFAMQRCKSASAACRFIRRLAEPRPCYIRFARFEDKLSSRRHRTLCAAADWFDVSAAQRKSAGPSRPDFSDPRYAHIEYIVRRLQGGIHADRWNLRPR